jgi:hypothetical protein
LSAWHHLSLPACLPTSPPPTPPRLQGAPVRRDGREPMARTVELAAVLADLATAGIPLDAESIAAGVLLEAADTGACVRVRARVCACLCVCA